MLRQLGHIALCCAAMMLVGCTGFRPLYGTSANGQSVVKGLSALAVQEQKTRAGQIVRNELLDGVAPGQARYAVNLVTTERLVDVASLSSRLGSRRRIALNAHYDLIEIGNGKTLTSGDSFANVEFDTINVPVSDLQAAEDARRRAGKELGQDLRLRLAAFLSTKLN